MRILLGMIVLLLAFSAHSSAGRILYVGGGTVTVERAGKLYRAVQRARLLEGDTLDTGRTGRVHIRMSDRSLLSLKPGTRFTIEEYRYEPPAQQGATADAREAVDAASRSFFRLVRGGLRAVTGLIGQGNRDAFRVTTSVATIGIRGTSFVADLEGVPDGDSFASDGSPYPMLADATGITGQVFDDGGTRYAQSGTPPGGGVKLTVGVGDGSVILSNPAGSLLLQNGEFGSVDGDNPPQLLLGQTIDTEAPDGGTEDGEAGEGPGETTDLPPQPVSGGQAGGVGDPPPGGNEDEIVTVDTEPVSQRNIAFVTTELTGVGLDADGSPQALTLTELAAVTDSNGDIISFIGGVDPGSGLVPAVFDLADGELVNRGADAALGLRWGRWGGETGVLRLANGDEIAFDLNAAQLHLIQSDVRGGAAVLPTTGSREFALIGNTDPTDQSGQIGFLGRASLSADFDQNSVTSSLGLTLGETVWSAQGSGDLGAALGAGTPGNVFGGSYSMVTAGESSGTGQFSGFLTNQAQGAGLSYQLNGGGDTINGTAAFAFEPASSGGAQQ